MKPFEACSVGKAKQNNFSKNSDQDPAKGNYKRIFINISSVNGKKNVPPVQSKRHWSIMVDERTNLKFIEFFTTHNGMVEPTLEKIEKWKNNGLVVKHIRLDNAS